MQLSHGRRTNSLPDWLSGKQSGGHYGSHRHSNGIMGRKPSFRVPPRRLRVLRYIFICLCLALTTFWVFRRVSSVPGLSARGQTSVQDDTLLVSYSYFEKDEMQRANFKFFLKIAMGVNSNFSRCPNSHFVVIVNGDQCSPCKALYPLLESQDQVKDFTSSLSRAWSSQDITLLQRSVNEGMDFAAHNVTLEWVTRRKQSNKYKFFMFLNSSVRGPFVPSYMPQGWHWHQAFTERLQGDIVGVSSSLVCLPHVDAGGPGPRMESWAFALNRKGLDTVVEAGVFWMRKCKLCTGDDGIVVKGEYGLSNILLSAGHNIATLMSRYKPGTDWRDPQHWACNDQAHPSRHGTYDHMTMHPFETVFIKASWHVGQPHLDHYSNWLWSHAQGEAGTAGSFDEEMYRYAISLDAQQPSYVDECYKVLEHAFA